MRSRSLSCYAYATPCPTTLWVAVTIREKDNPGGKDRQASARKSGLAAAAAASPRRPAAAPCAAGPRGGALGGVIVHSARHEKSRQIQ